MPPPAPAAAVPAVLQRGDGVGRLRFVLSGGRTLPAGLYQSDPVRLLFPEPERGEPTSAILVTTSGGLAGGDRIRFSLAADAGTMATVSTQAAEKIYRSIGPATRFDTTIHVGAGAWLEWLPQESILFDGARFHRTTMVDLEAGGRLLALEMLVFGRRARGEAFTLGMLRDDWRLRIGGRLAWADALALGDPLAPLFAARAGLDGAAAIATLLLMGDEGTRARDAVREVAASCPDVRIAASVVGPVTVARFLGSDAYALRNAVIRAAGPAMSGTASPAPPTLAGALVRMMQPSQPRPGERSRMNHTLREREKLLIAMAAMVARRRLERGVKLNHPEAVALAPLVGASLEVMDRDARRMRGQRPFLFSNLKDGKGVAEIVSFVEATGGLA